MHKGIVILRPPVATVEMRGQVKSILTAEGWTCESRQRFDGVMAVTFEKGQDDLESTAEEIEALLRVSALLSDAPFSIREVE